MTYLTPEVLADKIKQGVQLHKEGWSRSQELGFIVALKEVMRELDLAESAEESIDALFGLTYDSRSTFAPGKRQRASRELQAAQQQWVLERVAQLGNTSHSVLVDDFNKDFGKPSSDASKTLRSRIKQLVRQQRIVSSGQPLDLDGEEFFCWTPKVEDRLTVGDIESNLQ